MELSTYFRINQAGTGQFERTLLIADEGSYVSYLEGCTAPSRDENQLHAAVVELIAMEDAERLANDRNQQPLRLACLGVRVLAEQQMQSVGNALVDDPEHAGEA